MLYDVIALKPSTFFCVIVTCDIMLTSNFFKKINNLLHRACVIECFKPNILFFFYLFFFWFYFYFYFYFSFRMMKKAHDKEVT